MHNPDSPLLLGELKNDDVVKEISEPSHIDLGSIGILDEGFRKDLCDLLLMIADQDVNGLINQFIYMGVLEYTMDTTNLKRDLRDLFFRYFSQGSGGLNETLNKLLDLMQDYGVVLPNEFVSMAREYP